MLLTLNFAASETISQPQNRAIKTQRPEGSKKNYEFSHPGPTVKYSIWPLGAKCILHESALNIVSCLKKGEEKNCVPTLGSSSSEHDNVK